MRSFGSDNHSGIHPEVLRAIEHANTDHAPAYGGDAWTARAREKLRAIFGPDTEPYFVFNGTGANITALSPLLRSYHAVICSSVAHIYVDECAGVETFTGGKLIAIESGSGKLTPEACEPHLARIGDIHGAQPRVISITQPNEWGLVYTLEEVQKLAQFAHHNGLLLHMDGSRLANGCAALGAGLREATFDLGVDVLAFGGTKNGLMCGEAVIYRSSVYGLEPELFRKKLTQLASKMRFLAAQFEAYLTGDLWLKNAQNANAMARRLADELRAVDTRLVSRAIDCNMVYAALPSEAARRLSERYAFYAAPTGESRFVTSFDTTADDIGELVACIRSAISGT